MALFDLSWTQQRSRTKVYRLFPRYNNKKGYGFESRDAYEEGLSSNPI